MKTKLCIAALVTILSGCSGNTPASTPSPASTTAQATGESVAAAPHAYPQGSIKKGDMALCVICAVNDGATAKEPAHEVIDYQGKTYSFCNESEKADFISNPVKFAAK